MQLIRRDPNKGYLDSMLWVPKTHVNVEGVKNALTFEFYDQETVRYLMLYEETDRHLVVPRAFWKLTDLPYEFVDCRPTHYEQTGVQSKIKLDHRKVGNKIVPTGETLQQRAVDALMNSTGGTLQLGCGKGKTVVALHLISLMQVPAVIVVDNTHLLHQWMEEIERHLVVPGGVGLIGAGKRDWDKHVVMATYHSLSNWAPTMPEEVRRKYGLTIWDEGHHANAPWFSLSVPLFYGYRLALTATPNRSDGRHVICHYHVGDIIFKDVKQNMPPKIYFLWTGLELDLRDPYVAYHVKDKTEELHLGKLAVYFGKWRKRLTEKVLPLVKKKANEGRKILVLSNSVDEVINLMVLWTENDPNAKLYTDIPIPTKEEVGATEEPVGIKLSLRRKILRTIDEIEKNIANNSSLNPAKKEQFKRKLDSLKLKIRQDDAYRAVMREHRKRQSKFLKELLAKKSSAGIFTEAVEPEERIRMLKERQVIFAIMKYGKEGLDDKKLDTVIMSEPVSDKNVIQQVMGRPRDKPNAELIILEDNIGPLLSQCKNLRKHFKTWPADEGGPFKYELLEHPATIRRQRAWNRGFLRTHGL